MIILKITNLKDKVILIHDTGEVEGLEHVFSEADPKVVINNIPLLIRQVENSNS